MCSGFFFCCGGLPPQSKPAALPAPPRGRTPSQALPRQLPQRGSQAVSLDAKVLATMRKFPAVHLPLPLGEVASRSDDGEGEPNLPCSAALSQKAALQMQFGVTTPPVKMRLERSAELVRAKPFHLLTQTALPLKSPTGAFIAAQTRSLQTRNFK